MCWEYVKIKKLQLLNILACSTAPYLSGLAYIEVVTLTNNIAQGHSNTYNTRVGLAYNSRAYYKGQGVYAKGGETSANTTGGYSDSDQRSQTSVARRQTHTIDEV